MKRRRKGRHRHSCENCGTKIVRRDLIALTNNNNYRYVIYKYILIIADFYCRRNFNASRRISSLYSRYTRACL